MKPFHLLLSFLLISLLSSSLLTSCSQSEDLDRATEAETPAQTAGEAILQDKQKIRKSAAEKAIPARSPEPKSEQAPGQERSNMEGFDSGTLGGSTELESITPDSNRERSGFYDDVSAEDEPEEEDAEETEYKSDEDDMDRMD